MEDFLYEAIFIPEGAAPPPKSIVKNEDLQVYVRNFGQSPDDNCLVAETDGKIVGMIWSRIMRDYGHIADDTPSLAISLYKEYRNKGIGTELLRQMIILLRQAGYKKISLSVQKENYAAKMYSRAGFSVLKEIQNEYIMVLNLVETTHQSDRCHFPEAGAARCDLQRGREIDVMDAAFESEPRQLHIFFIHLHKFSK